MLNLKPIDKAHLVSKTVADLFDCTICRELVLVPKMCKNCQQIFCKGCITGWLEANK